MVFVWAILIGLLVSLVGQAPWIASILLVRAYPRVPPWEVPVMIVYLIFYCRYLKGWGWPRSTAQFRRENLPVRPLNGDEWAGALGLGWLAVMVAVGLQSALARVVEVPVSKPGELSIFPWYTLVPVLMMSGVVSGVVEEAGFRGYMQSMIQKAHGPVVAIGTVALVFAAAHLTHGVAHTLYRVPFYVAIGLIYGVMTYKTGSILPSLVIHAGGDVLENLFFIAAPF